MLILLDECVPRPFRRELSAHEVRTVHEMGWAGKKNGALLALMQHNSFEALVTTDQNLRHQQNISHFRVAVVVMVAMTNRLANLVPLAAAVARALENIQPGDVVTVQQ